MYVTSKPTREPIASPTTSLPSAAPFRTGLVASIEVTTTVTESLSSSDVAEIEGEIISTFNITAEDVSMVIFYSTTGNMVIEDTDLSEEQIVSTIEAALARELDIHTSDVKVSFDEETGEITFSISSDDAEALVTIADSMSSDDFEESLDLGESLVVQAFTAPADVVATVEISVDASDIEDVDDVVTSVTDALQEKDTNYVVTGGGKH